MSLRVHMKNKVRGLERDVGSNALDVPLSIRPVTLTNEHCVGTHPSCLPPISPGVRQRAHGWTEYGVRPQGGSLPSNLSARRVSQLTGGTCRTRGTHDTTRTRSRFTHQSNAVRFLRSPQGEYQIYLTKDVGGPATAALEIVGVALPLLGL